MIFKKFFSPVYLFHLILFLSFSISMNNLISFYYINLFFYALTHILIVYLVFYYQHFTLYFVLMFYGVFIDIFLLNEIGPHLIVFISLLVILTYTKKNLFNINPNYIFIIILLIVFAMYLFEMVIADIIFNYSFEFFKFFQLSLISSVIIYPIILFLSKIDSN